jgi:hypothetical protein
MEHVPLSIIRISPEEEELILYFRMLPPSVQAGIAFMISGNIPEKPDEQKGLTYTDPPRLVSSK